MTPAALSLGVILVGLSVIVVLYAFWRHRCRKAIALLNGRPDIPEGNFLSAFPGGGSLCRIVAPVCRRIVSNRIPVSPEKLSPEDRFFVEIPEPLRGEWDVGMIALKVERETGLRISMEVFEKSCRGMTGLSLRSLVMGMVDACQGPDAGLAGDR